MTNKNQFTPQWRNTPPNPGSFRSIFKYGDPKGFKHPNARLYEELKKTFALSDADFRKKETTGDEIVELDKPGLISPESIQKFEEIVGAENMSTKAFDRLRFSSGQTLEEHMKLRRQMVENISDLVVHPRNKSDVEKIVNYCNQQKIPVYVYVGGSSVNFGVYPEKGGISLVLSTHMNKVLELNETNQTVTVQAGIMGPALEEALNTAKEKYGTTKNYTCGHFPQSFEYSTIGGWVVTLGSGQQSSYYGDAADLVLAAEMVTPAGTIKTMELPATATGPKVLDMI